MKHFLVALLIAIAAMGIPALAAAGSPSVDYALEAKDAATGRPLVILHGRNLNRFQDMALKDALGATVLQTPDVVFKVKDSLVVGLSKDTPPGLYQLFLTGRNEVLLTVPVTILNNRPLPGSIKAEDLDPAIALTLAQVATKGDLAGLATKAELLAISSPDLTPYALKTDLQGFAQKAFKGTRAHVSGSGASIGASSGYTAIPMDTTDFDTDGCRDASVPEKLTCKTTGYYIATTKVLLSTGLYFVEVRKNGTAIGQDAVATQVYGGSCAVTTAVHLDKDDYLECWIKANSGGAFTVQAGSEFSMVKVGE